MKPYSVAVELESIRKNQRLIKARQDRKNQGLSAGLENINQPKNENTPDFVSFPK